MNWPMSDNVDYTFFLLYEGCYCIIYDTNVVKIIARMSKAKIK